MLFPIWYYICVHVTQIIRLARTKRAVTRCTLSSFTRFVPIHVRLLQNEIYISFALGRPQINERPDCSPLSLSLVIVGSSSSSSLPLRCNLHQRSYCTMTCRMPHTASSASHVMRRRYTNEPQELQTQISTSFAYRKKREEERQDILSRDF